MKLLSALLSLVVPACLLGACNRDAKPAREVVLYSSIDETYSKEVARLFEADTGIRVKLVSDTEATKSTGLLNRLIAEKERPVADVFWSGDPTRAAMLKARGIAAPYQPSGAEDLAPQHSDPQHAFTGSAGRLRLIIYHTAAAPTGSPLPSSVLDLADPRFASRSCLANPMFGTTSMHAAVLFATLGEEKAKKFFTDFTANGGRMLSSNGEVKRRVASGEFAFGLTDSDDICVALADGKSVGYIVPDQGPAGTGAVIIPTAAVLIQGAPHAAEAQQLVDFLVSRKVEEHMAQSTAGHFPLRQGVPGPELLPVDVAAIKLAAPDHGLVAGQMEALQGGFLKEWSEAQSR